MSTRSGRRIHGSLNESTVKTDEEPLPKTERKTRNKVSKENIGEQNTILRRIKKRENYVSYPTDDEQVGETGSVDENESHQTRASRKNALKEHNPTIIPTEVPDCEVPFKNVRSTRRTRKFAENASEISENVEVPSNTEAPEIKTKKSKRKKAILSEGHGEEQQKPKKKNKKKKGKRSDSFVIEKVEDVGDNMIVNKANVSNDSFHSAAGSPKQNEVVMASAPTESEEAVVQNDLKLSNMKAKKSLTNQSFEKRNSNFEVGDTSVIKNSTFELNPSGRKSSIKLAGMEVTGSATKNKNVKNDSFSKHKMESNTSQIKNNTFEIEPLRRSGKMESPFKINTTYEKDVSQDLNSSKSRKRKSSDVTDSNDISAIEAHKRTKARSSLLNSTYDKSDSSAKVNTTFELDKNNLALPNKTRQSIGMNATFEKETASPKSNKQKSINCVYSLNNKSMESIKNDPDTASLNATFETKSKISIENNNRVNKEDKLNATYEKDQNVNSTFDKVSKSSLISSDSNTDDISRISITSDESISEPVPEEKKPATIMNETPVLIDSTLEESIISENVKSDKVTVLTPLRREGTFTKDGPDDPNGITEKDTSPIVTPRKNMSLPSPGCTPFPNRSSTKEKPLLNVTRSIEKSRKSSGVEPAPRTTRVMFCSPVNNPVVVAQQKRMVIKSNLKGSNKSFVYEESDSMSAAPPAPRAAGRKRSHTHSEAEGGAKRSRLADQRHSTDRLSRPRTSSANPKLTDSTTPTKTKVSRTKLPNFAALHRRQFDKMESLDECQLRKARRARELLTPTPAHADNTPKTIVEPQKDQLKKEVVTKAETPVKSLTQEASKPNYTRFGFKLNLDVNPFSIPSKTAVKPKENPQKLSRQVTLPSLAGATSVRREAAKQVVMREKSFTDKRQLKRNENRTIIKGVRTNRRFELQMKLRNLE